MDINFENRRILVTGAGRGLGRVICKALVEVKATVIALSQTQANLESLAKECPSIQWICVDLKNWEATKAAVKSVLPIHGLVNNAGVLHIAEFLDITPEQLDEMYNLNLRGYYNVGQVVAADMKETGVGGTIVNMSSAGSTIAVPGVCAYGSIKSAVDMMTKVMAVELGPFNIRVNCVNPTIVVPTEMGQSLLDVPGVEDALKGKTPLRKFAEQKDVTNAVLFLLSDKSAMTTGSTFLIDGGLAVA